MPEVRPQDERQRRAARSGGQLPSLTGMRWAAAFMVFLYHVRNFGYYGGEKKALVDWAFGPGLVGVSFFFILSGFVLAWSARPGDRVLAFLRRRLARVYPVHLVTALAALALGFTVLPKLRPDGWQEVVANLLLVSAWDHGWWQVVNPVSWSLVSEAFFYLCFPAVYAVLRRFGPRALTAVVVLAVATVVCLPKLQPYLESGFVLNTHPVGRVPEFILGVAVARLVQLGRWRGPGLEGALALTLIGYFMYPHIPGSYGATTVVGFTLLIAAAAVADIEGRPSMWRGAWLVRLGEWSFSFYMVHLLVLLLTVPLLGDKPHFGVPMATALTVAVFAVSLALSAALYHWVELPGRRLILRRMRRG
ncbi:acyltransferase family protein [Streptomyces tritici]|uniref:acyltransferase family protein n=1 Tax=Streptomyces tritici TaxID=2054410 RepID=UPI003AEF6FD9